MAEWYEMQDNSARTCVFGVSRTYIHLDFHIHAADPAARRAPQLAPSVV